MNKNSLSEGLSFPSKIKTTFVTQMLWILRLVTGFFLGLTLGLILHELIGFGFFSLSFLVVVFIGLFLKISQGWNFTKILVFDLICMLVLQLLKMYIFLAP